MKNYFILLAILILTNCQTKQESENIKVPFYVGTYTNGESKGIYEYQIDNNGVLTKIGLKAEIENPSFLTKTSNNQFLLAVSEVDNDKNGFVTSYKIDKDSLTFLNTSKSGGAHPCYITTNNKGDVLVANYTGGNVGYLKLDKEGNLSDLLAVQQHEGKGTTSRQEAPHAHSTFFNPKKNEIISVDLGTNQLWFSTIDGSTNVFKYQKQKTLNMIEGAGPRHLTFHPSKNWIYVLNELDNTVSLVEEDNNNYFISSTISMLPDGFNDYSKGADIHISDDGKFLYASNRGHNSIVIYRINTTNGDLELIGFENTKGENPRNFSLTPDNNFLLVANQDTNNIICFKRDFETGKLTFVNEVSSPNPVCILF